MKGRRGREEEKRAEKKEERSREEEGVGIRGKKEM